MTSIGFYEARTHLSELLDQVARGKKVLITRRGKPAALLSPPPVEAEKDVRQVIRQMKELRRGNILGKGLSVRDLIEEGRRY
ncbi:MAG TPA: type II toxin-antitoxin system prevent-host-death family antitoxin [Gemmataceae bacterium]|nr:type II toxin-antitoxin system prevent-host-death family antitoxin [Gemmataceae bacterium]